MYFKFPCEHCGKNLKVSEENVGRRARCPYCHKMITVPQVSAADIPVATPRNNRPKGSSTQKITNAPGGAEWADGTNAPMMQSAVIGVVLSVVFIAVIFPFRLTYFGNLFIKTGTGSWVPYAEVFLMAWCMGILFIKSRKFRRQKDSMLFDVLPTDIAEDIAPENLDKFIEHVRGLPAKPSESFLINRVLRGLEHYGIRKSHGEVATIMSSQSDIDANAVDSSYTMVKVFLWAIPILGFIGTVVGISAAVKGFSGSMDQAANISVLKSSLSNVTTGLATAFDTTFVALVMSLLISFPASSLQKSEEDLLNWVDEYCNENLLKRLCEDEAEAVIEAGDPAAIARAVEKAMVAQKAELEAWRQKLEAVGSTITQQVADGWQQMHERLQQEHEQKLEQLNQVVAALSGEQNLSSLASEVRDSITTLREQTQAVQTEVADSMRDSAQSLQTYFNGLKEGLAALNEVLTNLGEKQIKIETHVHGRRGWFFGRRTNGD